MHPEHPEALRFHVEGRDGEPGTVHEIPWQLGPVGEVGRNGIQAEEVLSQVKEYLTAVNHGEYENQHTTDAIDSIDIALASLHFRTAERAAAGVEGTSTP